MHFPRDLKKHNTDILENFPKKIFANSLLAHPSLSVDIIIKGQIIFNVLQNYSQNRQHSSLVKMFARGGRPCTYRQAEQQDQRHEQRHPQDRPRQDPGPRHDHPIDHLLKQLHDHLKGLSHEMVFASDDMYG